VSGGGPGELPRLRPAAKRPPWQGDPGLRKPEPSVSCDYANDPRSCDRSTRVLQNPPPGDRQQPAQGLTPGTTTELGLQLPPGRSGLPMWRLWEGALKTMAVPSFQAFRPQAFPPHHLLADSGSTR